VLKNVKLSLLGASKSLGLLRVVQNSRWRDAQLLILCYHGISLDDEDEWAPGLYMSAGDFEERLEILKRRNCSVLPLDEGIKRLYAGTLPPRSVVITFDDGMVDFHHQAWPLLKTYGFPATVYLTTYYSEHQYPVFPLICSYLLWKGRGGVVSAPAEVGNGVFLDLRSSAGRQEAQEVIGSHADARGLSGAEKDALARSLAGRLGIDYDELLRSRILQVMNAAEVRAVAGSGIDVQLHTHRHRSPLDRALYRREITENGARIRALTGVGAVHFCYPSGIWKPEFGEWLAEEGVISATTCETGMATRRSEPLRLPRLLDHSGLSAIEFEAWITGFGSLLPRRRGGRVQDVDSQGKLIPAGEQALGLAG
jgi:peptidoglycan/xylan/chitin deacetylase (PgdA/CDA1 family)